MTAQVEVAIVGAGVVGCATALELARRGADVVVIEAEPEPALQASGTNSGILHAGFDSIPGEPETEMLLRSARVRDPVIDALAIPILRCGATMRPLNDRDQAEVARLGDNAARNGVEVELRDDGTLDVPSEAVTDPVAYTLALAQAAQRHGAELRTGSAVVAVERAAGGGLRLGLNDGAALSCRVAVNCAGLGAGRIARAAGDDSFDVYPRKGEFLVFEPPEGEPLERILLPVPSRETKGVLVFPTVDGKVVAGPTAIDQEDPDDWAVRPQATAEILAKAGRLYPPLERAEPIAAYAGLRPAGRGVNYVLGRSPVCGELIHAAAIRSTGMTASLGIAERVAELVGEAGISLGEPAPLSPAPAPPSTGSWWRRTAEHRARIGDTPIA